MNSDDKLSNEQSEQLLPLDFIDSDNDKKTTVNTTKESQNKKIEVPKDNVKTKQTQVASSEKTNQEKIQPDLILSKPKKLSNQTVKTTENKNQVNTSKEDTKETNTTEKPSKPKVITPDIQKKTVKNKSTQNKPTTVSQKKQQKPLTSIKISSNSSLGQILREARIRKNLSVEQIAQSTKIKKKFIIALEEEKYDLLPAKVYISAYIRSLSALYDIPADSVLCKIPKESKQNQLPDDLINHIQEGKQVNEKEEEKIKKFFKVAAIAICTIIILIIAISYWPSKKQISTQANQVESTTNENTQSDIENSNNQELKHTTNNLKSISSDDLKVFIYPKPFTMTHAEIPQN